MEVLISRTGGDRGIICKNFTVELKLSDKSLMEIKKNNGLKIDPSGTPTSTGNQSDV